MSPSDFREFSELLDSVAALLGKPAPGTKQAAMFFRVLAEYPIEVVRKALDAHLRDPQRGRFFPAPADVISKIDAANGPDRPCGDEAWAIALRAADEAQTVVWTEDMAQAWAVCKPVMDQGDEVGARMAFKGAYERITAQAKAANKPVHWTVSEGHDKDLRVAAVQRAASAGLMLPHEAAQALPLLEHHQADRAPIPEPIRLRLLELRGQLARHGQSPSAAEVDRIRTAELKAGLSKRLADSGHSLN